MKLLVCIKCGDMNTLGYQEKACACGATGGRYNPDGDTVTVFGVRRDDGLTPPGLLLGLNNRAIHHAAYGRRVNDAEGLGGVLWPYDLDNGKVTHEAR